MNIAWSDHLIHVKYSPMQSHVLEGSQIHNPLVHAIRICFISHYKCVVVIVLRIFCLFSLFVFCFVTKTHNVAHFVIIETQFYTLMQK